jgi:hypothetical protein
MICSLTTSYMSNGSETGMLTRHLALPCSLQHSLQKLRNGKNLSVCQCMDYGDVPQSQE